MAIYQMDPTRYGINPIAPGISSGIGSIIAGLLARNDPRNIEIRRAWGDPEKHLTPQGWAPGTPQWIKDMYNPVGAMVPVKDAKGNVISTQWEQRFIPKSEPLPAGFQLLAPTRSPYSMFPTVTTTTPTVKPVAASPTQSVDYGSPIMESILRSLGMGNPLPFPNIFGPTTLKKGGEVASNAINDLITLLQMERNLGKDAVPAILHEGETVLTKEQTELLKKKLDPGTLKKLNVDIKDAPDFWNMLPKGVPSSTADDIQATTPSGKLGEKKPSMDMIFNTLPGETLAGAPFQPNLSQYNPYTDIPNYGPIIWDMISPGGGSMPPQPTQTTPLVVSPQETKPIAVQKTGSAKPPVEKSDQETNIPTSYTPQPTQPQTTTTLGYAGWNDPLRYNYGQTGGLDPMAVLGMIQAEVARKGSPFPGAVYGAEGNVLANQPTTMDKRTELVTNLFSQYLSGLSGQNVQQQTAQLQAENAAATPEERKALWKAQATKTAAEAEMTKPYMQAQIDDINNRIKYNNALIQQMSIKQGEGGLTPDDMYKIAQTNQINANLANLKVNQLETALKTSLEQMKAGVGNQKSHELLIAEYMFNKQPWLADLARSDPDAAIKYIGGQHTGNPEFLGIGVVTAIFGGGPIKWKSLKAIDLQTVAQKVINERPMPIGTLGQDEGSSLLDQIETGASATSVETKTTAPTVVEEKPTLLSKPPRPPVKTPTHLP